LKSIDINADVGEGYGFDAVLMRSITSANVAAGIHAGSPVILDDTIRLAKAHGVSCGAHPGFDDREHFGRRELPVTPDEVQALVRHQTAIVAAAARIRGVRLRHVKLHGALYNMAARDRSLADAVTRALVAFDASLVLFAPSHSELLSAGLAAGLRVASEVFADRGYSPGGALASRGAPGGVIHDPDDVVARAVRMVVDGSVIAVDGSVVKLQADTICVHGDTPGCDVLAQALRSALGNAGLVIGSAS
jgi:UPF0271 protein